MEKRYLRNNEISVPRVMVLSSGGDMLGEMPTSTAKRLADDENLDLVMIAPNQNPPVCRIVDFGAFMYKEQKKLHESSLKSKTMEVKEIRLRPGIDVGDFKTKVRQASEFLDKGHKVRLTLKFKGREISHAELGVDVLMRFGNELVEAGTGVFETVPKMDGRQVLAVIAPKREKEKKSRKSEEVLVETTS